MAIRRFLARSRSSGPDALDDEGETARDVDRAQRAERVTERAARASADAEAVLADVRKRNERRSNFLLDQMSGQPDRARPKGGAST